MQKIKPKILLTLQAGNDSPSSWQVDTAQLTRGVWAVVASYGLFLLGTLLFFRELEINRRLEEKVLALQTKQQPVETNVVRAPAAAAPTEVVAPPVTVSTSSSAVKARLAELGVECHSETCDAKISLLPTGTGTAEGSLIMILETEVPRIGTATAGGQIRKRFIVYPGMENRDELDQAALDSVAAKGFRFTRGLNSTISFQVGKLLRPLALNLYLYDKDKNVLVHERRQIETE